MAPRAKKELVWNVFIGDCNRREIRTFNIFKHHSFYGDVVKFAKKYKDNRDEFEEQIRRSLMYYFWSKCEWEIILTGWPTSDDYHDEKVDVYEQVRMNWEPFMNYLWENKGSAK